MSSKQNTTIGGNSLILGSNSGTDDFNIVGTNGRDIKINGIVPSDSGGGGVPPIGDVSFIGNLVVNDNIDNLGDKGNIIFGGQDIYHSTPQVPGQPVVDDISYVTFKQLAEKNENQLFTGQNDFAERVRIQLSDGATPPNYTDKITFNTSGNIECVDINNSAEVKTNSVICENGETKDQLVKARQYHFRPDPAETTGWVFSQKPPDNPAIPADNYLMLQNTQTTGSLNLVKSTFDPLNPTPFDIILDPQNGQVKTATSFDAPQVNFRKNAVDNWSISQPATGDPEEGTLIARSPNTLGSFNIFDSASSPWAQFASTGTTLPKPTTINNTLNVNGNTTLSYTSNLLFGAYSFQPIQYLYSTAITIRDTPDTTNYTNMIFNALGTPSQPTLGGKNLWTRVNDGQTGVSLYNNELEGFYKCSIKQTGDSSSTNFRGTEIIYDYILAASIQDTPDLTPPISYGYNTFPADRAGPPVLSTTASILIDHKQSLASQSQPVFLNFSNPPVVGETMPILVTLTKLNF